MKIFRQYNNNFYSNLKKVKICNRITIAISLICIVSQIIQCILDTNELHFFNSNWRYFTITYMTAFYFSTSFGFGEINENAHKGEVKIQYFGETKWDNDYIRFLLHIILSFTYNLFTVFMTILSLILTKKIPGELWNIMGRTFLFYLPIYIADVFLIKNLIIIKNNFENSPPEYKIKNIAPKK